MKITQKSSCYDLENVKGPMMHGHTSIVLKNVKTGLVERVESENTFQSAILQNYHKDYGCLVAGNNTLFSDLNSHFTFENNWKTKVGGLFLFRDAITAGTQFMPGGNLMVGNAKSGLTHTGLPTETGSWNEIESSASASAITQVYDFATDQANGLIGCVCLTSNVGGGIGYGNVTGRLDEYYMNTNQKVQYGGAISTSNPQTRAFEAWSKNIQHTFSLDNSGVLTVTKVKRPVTNGTIFDGSSSTTPFDLSSDIPSGWRGNLGIPEVVAEGIIRMFCGSDVTVNAGDDMYYIEYNVTSGTATVNTITNSSSRAVHVGNKWTSKFVMGGYAIVGSSSGYYEIFNASNSTLVGEFLADTADSNVSSGSNYDAFPDLIAPDLFCVKKDNAMMVYDAVADTLKPINLHTKGGGAGQYSVFTQHGEYEMMRGLLSYDYGFIIHNPLYLATINNLGTPVTKTAAQTMKVTYTLTEA